MKYVLFLFALPIICFSSCSNEKIDQNKETQPDIQKRIDGFRTDLATSLESKTIDENGYPCYHLLLESSFGLKRSIKIEANNDSYTLSSKTITKEDSSSYSIKIDESDWNKFKFILNEFDFWDVKAIKYNEPVLDPTSYFFTGKDYRNNSNNDLEFKRTFRKGLYNDKLVAIIERIVHFESSFAINLEHYNGK